QKITRSSSNRARRSECCGRYSSPQLIRADCFLAAQARRKQKGAPKNVRACAPAKAAQLLRKQPCSSKKSDLRLRYQYRNVHFFPRQLARRSRYSPAHAPPVRLWRVLAATATKLHPEYSH